MVSFRFLKPVQCVRSCFILFTILVISHMYLRLSLLKFQRQFRCCVFLSNQLAICKTAPGTFIRSPDVFQTKHLTHPILFYVVCSKPSKNKRNNTNISLINLHTGHALSFVYSHSTQHVLEVITMSHTGQNQHGKSYQDYICFMTSHTCGNFQNNRQNIPTKNT